VVITFRWAEGRYDKLPALAADLVAVNVAVLVTAGGPGRKKGRSPSVGRITRWDNGFRFLEN
jgi:hypothetical protein